MSWKFKLMKYLPRILLAVMLLSAIINVTSAEVRFPFSFHYFGGTGGRYLLR